MCSALVCTSVKPARAVPDLASDARAGLLSEPRSLPPKYFYDERGSRLFEEICDTREYYPTRTEKKLLSHHSAEIIEYSRPAEIVELGSGSSRKTRHLFDACEKYNHTCSYAPFDVCEPMLKHASEQLCIDYDWLKVRPLLGDYHGGLKHLPKETRTRLYVFLGGTIGNFYPQQARAFMREVRVAMRPGDYLLIGADRVKDQRILNAAYNDEQGLTAAFNLNLLNVLNRELQADFKPAHFNHQATFNPQLKRVEMRLMASVDQVIHLRRLNERISFQRGDGILTEISHKFTADELRGLIENSGLGVCKHYEPDNGYFSLILARRAE